MVQVQMLRMLMEQRLKAVVEEIFGLFERTVAEYEEELSRSKKENERQRQLLDQARLQSPAVKEAAATFLAPPWLPSETLAVTTPLRLSENQQESVKREAKIPFEQQEWSSNVWQDEPPPSCVKEEEEEPWKQLQILEEANVTMLTSAAVFMRSQDDKDDEGHSLHLHHSQSEENTGAEPPNHCMTTEGVGDDTSESSETELSDEDKEPLDGNKDSKSHMRHHTDKKNFDCLECGKSFKERGSLNRHVRTHTGEKPFVCPVCAKRFSTSDHMNRHMMIHTGQNPFSCSVCAKRFKKKYEMMLHMRMHTDEKPFTCSVCNKGFSRKQYLTTHIRSHTEEEQFTCPLCPKRFTCKNYVMIHMRTHTGEKPFRCDVCEKRFTYKYQVSRHKCATVLEAAGT